MKAITLKEAREKLWSLEFESPQFLPLLNTILFSFSADTVIQYVKKLEDLRKLKKQGKEVTRKDFLELLDEAIVLEKNPGSMEARLLEGMKPLMDDTLIGNISPEEEEYAKKYGVHFMETLNEKDKE